MTVADRHAKGVFEMKKRMYSMRVLNKKEQSSIAMYTNFRVILRHQKRKNILQKF